MASLNELLKQVDRKRKELDGLLPLAPEQKKKLDQKFRLEFNYNSNHLEGNTLTYGETKILILTDQTTGAHEMREFEEMKAHDLAIKMIQEEAKDEDRPQLTENFIRSLNNCLLVREFWKDAQTSSGEATQKKIVPGQYKTTPNSVRLQNGEIFDYTAPESVAAEMQDLVGWFNEHIDKEDPLVMASLLHYRFVRIHPFDDGNGRVARLLMNYVFLKKDYPLVVIKSEKKKEYLLALSRADAGDLPAFTAHIAEQLLWSYDLWIKAASNESLEEEDDLEKELALLKSELDRKPDNFGKKRSSNEIAKIIEHSTSILATELRLNLATLEDYFVNIEVKTQGSAISITCNTLKKVNERIDIYIAYELDFNDDYLYKILDSTTKKEILSVAYGYQMSSADIKLLVDHSLRYIINKIKSAID